MNKEEKEKMGGRYVGNTDAHTLSPVDPCVCVQILRIESKQIRSPPSFLVGLFFPTFNIFHCFLNVQIHFYAIFRGYFPFTVITR